MKQFVRKMLFVDLIKGLGVTFRNQAPKTAHNRTVSSGAPAGRRAIPRGASSWRESRHQ